ncbi:hypothetical protein NPIL_383671 [Nephila pilipes]|uniref:Uncharacterized protein n=1 Tax=Nephila pilipes TaxID=299642 RepID=A0A8X6TQP1_NEPPI|nr:hypothetical protein NPIL_383671 [Nephila pilipes]
MKQDLSATQDLETELTILSFCFGKIEKVLYLEVDSTFSANPEYGLTDFSSNHPSDKDIHDKTNKTQLKVLVLP